jgi:hypothetical protein
VKDVRLGVANIDLVLVENGLDEFALEAQALLGLRQFLRVIAPTNNENLHFK